MKTLKHLPIDAQAADVAMEYEDRYLNRLMRMSHVVALDRNGDSIQSGDVTQAFDMIEGKNRRLQLVLATGSAGIGASLSGMTQNMLDGKPLIYATTFALIGACGVLAVRKAFSR